jgi:hypothetical protein
MRKYSTAAIQGFHPFVQVPLFSTSLDAGWLARSQVTEIRPKCHQDVIRPALHLRKLAMLCEELSYFD